MKSKLKGIIWMDDLKLFMMALGMSEPWQVIDIRFSKEEGQLDLKIDFSRGANFSCPSCGEKSAKLMIQRIGCKLFSVRNLSSGPRPSGAM